MNILSLSYGKDRLACLGACEQLGIKIDRIVHAEVWATDTIPADLPPMVEFKKHADRIIKERYGIEVEHICALKTQGVRSLNLKQAVLTYEDMFYHHNKVKNQIQGFPISVNRGNWCTRLKQLRSQTVQVEREREREPSSQIVQILGIAADEPKRIERHSKRDDVILPLVEIGWTEAMCREWCE